MNRAATLVIAALACTPATACNIVLGIEELPEGHGGSGGEADTSDTSNNGSTATGMSTSAVGSTTAGTGGCGSSTSGGGTPPSCADGALCGSGQDSCCESILVEGTGGMPTFHRDKGSLLASVSDFRLDKYEVTVGRFTAFVAQYVKGATPLGAGGLPGVCNSGWIQSYEDALPGNKAALEATLDCDAANHRGTYKNGGDPHKPINCVSWYLAFAFCAWDGGRLPTELELNYAEANGGFDTYPWGVGMATTALALYGCNGDGAPACLADGTTEILPVGTHTGNGTWGHADLAGSVTEWGMDYYEPDYPQGTCNDCVNLTTAVVGPGDNEPGRVIRGGSWNAPETYMASNYRRWFQPSQAHANASIGFRCARLP